MKIRGVNSKRAYRVLSFWENRHGFEEGHQHNLWLDKYQLPVMEVIIA